jgi:predicted nucleic acid-binding protein
VAVLVFDTSPLSHFARAGRVDTLRRLTTVDTCHVTRAVLEELRTGAAHYPELARLDVAWLAPARIDDVAGLTVFHSYARILGAGRRNLGEAATLTWAELHHATAVVDDRAAWRAGTSRGVSVHGTLWLVAEGFRAALLGEDDVVDLVDDLARSEAWLPCDGRRFFAWARENGLLPDPENGLDGKAGARR